MTVADALRLAGGDPANVPLIISDVLDAELCAVHVGLLYEELPVLSDDERACMLNPQDQSRVVVHGFLSIDSPPFPEIIWVQPDGSASWHLDWSEDAMGGNQWREVRCAGIDFPDPEEHREFTWSDCDDPTILFRRGFTDEPILVLVTPGTRVRLAIPADGIHLDEGESRRLWMVERDTPRPRWSVVGSATRVGDLIHAEWTGPESQWRAVDSEPATEALPEDPSQGLYDLLVGDDYGRPGPTLGTVEFNWVVWLDEADPPPTPADVDPERAILSADGIGPVDIGTPMDETIADLETLLGPPVAERTWEDCREWLTRSIQWPGDIFTNFASSDRESLNGAAFTAYWVGGSAATTEQGITIGTPVRVAVEEGTVVTDRYLPYGAASIELDGGLWASLDKDVSDVDAVVDVIATWPIPLADC